MSKKRENKKILFFVLGMFFVALSVFFIVKYTGYEGKAIFNPVIPSGCADSNIQGLWNSIFKESSAGIVILTDTSRSNKCDNYLAYKINADFETPAPFRSALHLKDSDVAGGNLFCNNDEIVVGAQNVYNSNAKLDKIWCASDNLKANSTKRIVDSPNNGGDLFCDNKEVVCGAKNNPTSNSVIDMLWCCGTNSFVNLSTKRLVDSDKLLGNLTCNSNEVVCGAKNNPNTNSELDMIWCCKYLVTGMLDKIKVLVGEEDQIVNKTTIIAVSGNFSTSAGDYLEEITQESIPSPETLISGILDGGWKKSRLISFADSSSDFSDIFKVPGSGWKTRALAGETVYSFYENETLASSFKETEGKVSANFTYDYFYYLKFENSTTPINCVQDWVEHYTNCMPDNTKTEYYLDLNNCGNITGMPENETLDCVYRGIIGNFSNLNTSRISLVVYINNSRGNNSRDYSGFQLQKVEFRSGSKTIIEFNWNFSHQALNLNEIYIEKQGSSASRGYLLVKGIEANKKVWVDKINGNSNKICVKNTNIDFIEEISGGCNGTYEYLISCPGTLSTYSCNLTENYFEIKGITHSGIVEFVSSLISPVPTGCIQNWSCTSWSSCANSAKTRTCTDTKNCNNNTGKPDVTQTCTVGTICTPNWKCADWEPSVCPEDETQTRTCTDLNGCNLNTGKPDGTQTCTYESLNLLILVIILVALIVIVAIIIFVVIKRRSRKAGPAVTGGFRPQNFPVMRRI